MGAVAPLLLHVIMSWKHLGEQSVPM